jgi:hypothetical protein
MTRYKVHTKKWKSCVRKVKKQSMTKIPYAVCTGSLGKKSFEKRK